MRRIGGGGGLGHRFSVAPEKDEPRKNAIGGPAPAASGGGAALHLRALAGVSRAIFESTDPARVFAAVWSAAVDLLADTRGGRVSIVEGRIDALSVVDLDEQARGDVARPDRRIDPLLFPDLLRSGLRAGRTVRFDHPDEALLRGVGLAVPTPVLTMFPLLAEHDVLGALFAGSQDQLSPETEDAVTTLANLGARALKSHTDAVEQRARALDIETRISETEGILRRLEQQIHGATFIEPLDANAAPVFVSAWIESLLGYPAADWRTDPRLWQRIIHAEDRERAIATRLQSRANGAPYTLQYRIATRDGRVLWVRDLVTLARESNGDPLYWQGVRIVVGAEQAQPGSPASEPPRQSSPAPVAAGPKVVASWPLTRNRSAG